MHCKSTDDGNVSLPVAEDAVAGMELRRGRDVVDADPFRLSDAAVLPPPPRAPIRGEVGNDRWLPEPLPRAANTEIARSQ